MADPMDIEAVVAGFDHHAHAQMQNPHAMYEALRAQCPVGRSHTHGGFVVVTRYDLVKQVYADFRSFSSADGTGLPRMVTRLLPIDTDPPLQTKFRRILNPEFTAEAVAHHRSTLERLVHDHIDNFIETGSADLLQQLIRPTLSGMVLPLLGVPITDQPQISAWVDYMIRRRHDDLPGVLQKTEALAGYLIALTDARRARPPGDDLLGLLIAARIDGEDLTNDTIFRILILLLFGGLDTTSAVMAEAILFLCAHPDQAQALLSGHLPWAPAIEEFVRLTSPVQGQRRVATGDVELAGVAIGQGESIFALIGAANRDPAQFPSPDCCLLDRAANEHLAFGNGAHICLGRNLARLEIEIMLSVLLRRLANLAIPTDFVPVYAVGESRGMVSLPVLFTPARPVSRDSRAQG